MTSNLIAGQLQGASNELSLEASTVSGEPYVVPNSSLLDMVKAIQGSHAADSSWVQLKAPKRQQLLAELWQHIQADWTGLLKAEARDSGRSLQFLSDQVRPAIDIQIEQVFQAAATTNGSGVGVSLIIGNATTSLESILVPAFAALAAGNPVIVKPSSRSSLVGQHLAELVAASQWKPKALNVLFGQGAELLPSMMAHPGIKAFCFTGRTATAKQLQSQAGMKLQYWCLGQSVPAIVLKDADPQVVAQDLVAQVSGFQGLWSPKISRILVAKELQAELLTALQSELQKRGEKQPSAESGITELPTKFADKDVMPSLVQSALSQEARVLEAPQGTHLWRDLAYCADIQQQELPGMVFSVTEFKYPFEAVRWANNSPYGSFAVIYTESRDRFEKLASGLQVAVVSHNRAYHQLMGAPLVGVKDSGFGAEPQQSWSERFRFRPML